MHSFWPFYGRSSAVLSRDPHLTADPQILWGGPRKKFHEFFTFTVVN